MRRRAPWIIATLVLLLGVGTVWLFKSRPTVREFAFLKGQRARVLTYDPILGPDYDWPVREYRWRAKYWPVMKAAEEEMKRLGATTSHRPQDVGRWWSLSDGTTVMLNPWAPPLPFGIPIPGDPDVLIFTGVDVTVFDPQPRDVYSVFRRWWRRTF